MAKMDLHEFELRYLSYKGMDFRMNLWWTQEDLLNLTRISDQWILEKSVPETSPEDLKRFTYETYTKYKKNLIESSRNTYPLATSKYSLADYIERLEYELKVIKEMGFNSYFLIVSDYVRWAKRQMIVVGPGRWSGAGSLLAWVTEITDVDPMPFDLLFERFLNPARISMPDFDIDFEDTQRQRVIDYCTNKYGQEKVCSIGTFMKLASKAAFKDSARAIGLAFERSNQVSNLIPDKVSLRDLVKEQNPDYEEVQTIYNTDDKVKKAFDYAADLEGNLRQLWVHACGIIIAPEPVATYSAVQYAKETDHTLVSQYDGPTLEQIGLLKMDFLWLRNLSIIKNCINIIKKKYEKQNKPLPEMFEHFLKTTSFQPDIHDAFTYDSIFKTGETTGIFQFESQGMRKFLIQLEPNSINDLVAMNALYRPGPMEFIPRYIERKHGREPVSYMPDELRELLTKTYSAQVAEEENQKLIQDLDPIMALTYGIAVYQEQLMFLVQKMAGFSLGEADMLRRGIGKKKKEVIEQLKKEFVIRGESFRGYKPETTTHVYEKMIEPAASYSFNKSHSVCYAMIAYQTAFLKAHFPIEFSAALIRSVEEDTDTQSFYISEIQNAGITIHPPHINESFNHVAAIDDEVRLWFFSIKGVGIDVGETIQQERQKNWRFTSLEDFLKRCSTIVNKKSLESLIKAGALEGFGDRNVLLENVQMMIDWSKNIATADFGLFGAVGLDTNLNLKQVTPSTHMERLMMEQEVLKAFLSGNPLDWLYLHIKRWSFLNQLKEQEAIQKFIITWYIKDIQRAKKKWFFIKIEDISGDWEFFTRDPYEFQKFDLIIMHGAKNNGRVYIDKIIKTTYDKLLKLAGGRFDPSRTVIRAKKERYWDQKQQEINKIKSQLLTDATPIDADESGEMQEPSLESIQNIAEQLWDESLINQELSWEADFEEEISESLDENYDNGSDFDFFWEDEEIEDEDSDLEVEKPELKIAEKKEEKSESYARPLPDDIQKLSQLRLLCRGYPWEIKIHLWGHELWVNEQGLSKIKDLLGQ